MNSDKLELSSWRMRADVSVLQFRQAKYEKYEMVVEEPSPLQSSVPIVQVLF